jgi:hypothetical protein
MDSNHLRRYPSGVAVASARRPIHSPIAKTGTDEWLSDERFSSQLRLVLASGGDERIWPDPGTGRNKYGVPVAPAPDEIWFSSSTASAISPLAFQAAGLMLRRLIATQRRDRMAVEDWFGTIRSRISRLFGVPGAMVVLTASGTEAELLALSVARSVMARPLINIVIAPGETGSGVLNAAGGKHFLASTSLAASVQAGAPIAGLETAPIVVERVEIREASGVARSSADIDREVCRRVAEALRNGQDVLVHVLDTSKSGLFGLSREAAEAIACSAPERVLIVVDACQLRCPARQIQDDLSRSHMVLLTGSKFVGGPPFSGALLLPPSLVERMQPGLLPEGLAAYSAYHDWPVDLRASLSLPFTSAANLGLGLRWEAALFEMETFAAIDRSVSGQIMEAFAAEVIARVDAAAWLTLVDHEIETRQPRSIIPVSSTRQGSLAYAESIHRALRSPHSVSGTGGRVCHLGQPVRVGDRTALRICASAPLVCAVAQEVAGGKTIEAALAPVRADLDCVFRKWEALVGPQ